MRRGRIVTIGGVPRELSPRDAERFDVVRGILVGSLRIDQGARRLRMPIVQLAQLVEGARRAVIAQLGESALEEARAAEQAG